MIEHHSRKPWSARRIVMFCRAAEALRTADILLQPLIGASLLLKEDSPLVRRAAQCAAITGAFRSSSYILGQLTLENGDNPLIHALWEAARGTLGHVYEGDWRAYEARLVYGAVVSASKGDQGTSYYATHSDGEIFQGLRETPTRWRFSAASLAIDDMLIPGSPCAQTSKIVSTTKRFNARGLSRAWLLHGPPGAGKTVAAAQIARALAPSVVTLDPVAAVSAQVWDALGYLRPGAIVLNDIDALSESGLDVLLTRVEQAHGWAKVIVSTANVREGLRGALQRPGRLADFAPVEYRGLDAVAVQSIAEHVDKGFQDPRLLAAYLAELDKRARAGGVSAADVEELLARQQEAGKR